MTSTTAVKRSLKRNLRPAVEFLRTLSRFKIKRERKIRGRMFTSSIKHCTRNLRQEVSRRSLVEHRKILKSVMQVWSCCFAH